MKRAIPLLITSRINFFLLILFSVIISLSILSCTDEKAEQKKAIAAEYAERMTKKFLESFSSISGEQPSTEIISNKYNKSTGTVKVKFKSKWLGNPGYNPIASKESHEIIGILTIYGDGEPDYEVISKNEVLERNERNSAIIDRIIDGLELIDIFSEF